MNGMNTLSLMLKHATISALELSGVVTCEYRTVNGNHIPSMHVCLASKVLHVEAGGMWVQIDLRDAEYTSEQFTGSMSVITVTCPMFTVRITFTV